MSSQIIPFGKYKGQPVEVLVNDRKYTDWLMAQEWFRNDRPELYNIIVNNFGEPSDTPEHNRMQADFMKKEVRRKIVSQLYSHTENIIEKYDIKVNDYSEQINAIKAELHQLTKTLDELKSHKEELCQLISQETKMNREKLRPLEYENSKYLKLLGGVITPIYNTRTYPNINKEEHSKLYNEYCRCRKEIRKIEEKKDAYIEQRNNCQLEIYRIEKLIKEKQDDKMIMQRELNNYLDVQRNLKNNDYGVDKVEFEVDGWDVYMRAGRPYNIHIYCELKPSIGDDYPAILREMKIHRNISAKTCYRLNEYGEEMSTYYLLIYRELNTTTISEEELIAYFKTCGFEVMKI